MDREFCFDDKEDAAAKVCHLCLGEEFIYIGVQLVPCPECWGSGEEEIEEIEEIEEGCGES